MESAWILIGKDPQMRQGYLRIKFRGGAKRAIIAIAQNLSGRIWRMLRTHEPYVAGAEAAGGEDSRRCPEKTARTVGSGAMIAGRPDHEVGGKSDPTTLMGGLISVEHYTR